MQIVVQTLKHPPPITSPTNNVTLHMRVSKSILSWHDLHPGESCFSLTETNQVCDQKPKDKPCCVVQRRPDPMNPNVTPKPNPPPLAYHIERKSAFCTVESVEVWVTIMMESHSIQRHHGLLTDDMLSG